MQVLNLVQEILPPIGQLNCQLGTQLALPASTCTVAPPNGENGNPVEPNTTSQHYAIVESDHPYKPACVANYRVTKRHFAMNLDLFWVERGVARTAHEVMYVSSSFIVVVVVLVGDTPPPSPDLGWQPRGYCPAQSLIM